MEDNIRRHLHLSLSPSIALFVTSKPVSAYIVVLNPPPVLYFGV